MNCQFMASLLEIEIKDGLRGFSGRELRISTFLIGGF